jgi:hypothetical protein
MNPQLLDHEIRLMHRHEDGSWAEMEPEHLDSAQHDPEQDWGRWRVFRCRSCPELLTVRRGEEDHLADDAQS